MSYINGGEADDRDPEDRNPTGRRRRSSSRTRRKKDRRLFRGTPWAKPDERKGKGS